MGERKREKKGKREEERKEDKGERGLCKSCAFYLKRCQHRVAKRAILLGQTHLGVLQGLCLAHPTPEPPPLPSLTAPEKPELILEDSALS